MNSSSTSSSMDMGWILYNHFVNSFKTVNCLLDVGKSNFSTSFEIDKDAVLHEYIIKWKPLNTIFVGFHKKGSYCVKKLIGVDQYPLLLIDVLAWCVSLDRFLRPYRLSGFQDKHLHQRVICFPTAVSE